MMLEWRLSKEQILELYLNRVHLGAGTYGVEKMSRHLFGKPARELTLAESALIAGLIQRRRRCRMVQPCRRARPATSCCNGCEKGFITEAEESCKSGAPARPYPRSDRADNGAAKLFVRQQFRAFGGDHPPDWKVRTTIRGPAERSGEGRRARARTNRPTRSSGGAGRCAAGERYVVALVGGRDLPAPSSIARREVGGSRVRVQALRHRRGAGTRLHRSRCSISRRMPVKASENWRPRNANYSSDEPMPLREAFISPGSSRGSRRPASRSGRVRFSIWEATRSRRVTRTSPPWPSALGSVAVATLRCRLAVFPTAATRCGRSFPRPSRTRMASKCGSMTTRPSA